jgi:hypothetical protein
MSFLDVQDLALLAVQFDLDQLYSARSGEERSLLGALGRSRKDY